MSTTDRADEWRRAAAARPRTAACWRCGRTRRVVRVSASQVGPAAGAAAGGTAPDRDLCFRCFLELR